MLRVVTYALEVVEIFCRYSLKHLPHPSHRYLCHAIASAIYIEPFAKVAHHLSSLCDAYLHRRPFQVCADMLHGNIVHPDIKAELGTGHAFRYSSCMRIILPQEKNPTLRQKAEEVLLADIKGKRTQTLIKDMKTLLSKEEYGVALAAPQVGESLRLFIVSGRALLRQAQDKLPRHPSNGYDESPDLPQAESRDQIYINPELTKVSRKKSKKHEGCLSIRGFWGTVPRAEKATIRAYDERGKLFTRGASGFLAHVFQHEMDHLEGILYTDKAVELYEEQKEK